MISNLYKYYTESSGISTDTRNVKPGNIFFALKGPNFNGNKYASQALEKGAILAVIDEEEFLTENCILVTNVLETLQDLASYHVDQLNIPIIGITGSNGKTTTKELTFAVLSTTFKTFCTQGNLNNHIGVPLTILSISNDIEIAIIELGANHIGEIELLCKIAKPTHGIITNIGMDHLEGYGSIEGVAKGNSELYYHLLKNQGWVFVNSEDELLVRMASRLENRYTYPAENDHLHLQCANNDLYLQLAVNDISFTTQLTGKYNLYNIGAALAIGQFFKVPLNKATEAVANYKPSNMRSQLIENGTNRIILDAYNANPSSMEVALANLNEINASKKIAILGDMFELGNVAETEHERIASLANNYNFDSLILIGHDFAQTKLNANNVLKFETRELAEVWLKNQTFENTTFLLKGSRGMALEKILTLFEKSN